MTHELLNQPSNKYYLDYFQGFNYYKQYYNCYLCFGYMYNYSSRIHWEAELLDQRIWVF